MNTGVFKINLTETFKENEIWIGVSRIALVLGISLAAIMNDVSTVLAQTPGPTETPTVVNNLVDKTLSSDDIWMLSCSGFLLFIFVLAIYLESTAPLDNSKKKL